MCLRLRWRARARRISRLGRGGQYLREKDCLGGEGQKLTKPCVYFVMDVYWPCASDSWLVGGDQTYPVMLGEVVGLGKGVSAAVQTTTDYQGLSLWVPDV